MSELNEKRLDELIKNQLDFINTGDYKKALIEGKKAIQLAEETKSFRKLSIAYRYDAFTHRQIGEAQEAVKLGETSLKIAIEHGFLEEEARAKGTLATIYYIAGKLERGITIADEALENYSELLEKLEINQQKNQTKINDLKNGIGSALINQGNCYQGLSQIIDAIRCYTKGLDFYTEEAKGGNYYIVGLLNLAGCHYYLEDYEVVEKHLKIVLEVVEEQKNEDLLGRAYYILGGTVYMQKKYNEALVYFLKAVKLLGGAESNPDLSIALAHISRLYLLLDDTVRAEENIIKAMDLAKKINVDACYINVYIGYAHLKKHQEKWNEAEKYLKKSIDLCKNNGVENKKDLKNNYLELSYVYELQGKYEEGLHALRNYVTLYQQLATKREKMQMLLIEYKYKSKLLKDSLTKVKDNLDELKSFQKRHLQLNNIRISFEDIVYITTKDVPRGNLWIWTEYKKQATMEKARLKEVTYQLKSKNPDSPFQNINKSTIVNTIQIQNRNHSPQTILMSNNDVLYVAPKYRTILKEKFKKF